MDSEHRHELQENDLAKWLAAQYEELKPRLPMYGVGAIAVVVLILGGNAWRKASATANAQQWVGFTRALEGSVPSPELLQQASLNEPGTAVAEWADITYADSQLFEASNVYFSNRERSEIATEAAVGIYERLAQSSDRDISERAAFQLARGYELQGKIDEAVDQYGRVTGAFSEIAKSRAERLESPTIRNSFGWLASAEAPETPATPGLDLDRFEPDDIALPEEDEEDVDAALDSLLQSVEGVLGEDEEASPTEEATEALSEEPTTEE